MSQDRARQGEGLHDERLRQELANTYFAEHAREWEDIYAKEDVHSIIHRHRLTTALAWVDRVPPAKRRHVLEVGCGAGLMALALAQRGALVTATDVVAPMVELTRGRVRAAGMADRVRITMGDARALPFRSAQFDLVVALGLMAWVASPEAAAVELTRVLKPGGFVLVNAGNRFRLSFLLDPRLNPYLASTRRAAKAALGRAGIQLRTPDEMRANLHSLGEFDRLLRSAGLEKVDSVSFGFGPFRFSRREFLPERLAVPLHRGLQGLADRGWPGLRSTGAQYIVLARKPASPDDGRE